MKSTREHCVHSVCGVPIRESLNLSSHCECVLTQVIGLYPGLLKPEVRKKFKASMPVANLEGSELETALTHLVNFLTQQRSRVAKRMNSGGTASKSLQELSEIIDTTLLKCYLKTNPALVGPLLRVENNCEVEESEGLLKENERYSTRTCI